MGRIEKTVFISYRRTNLPWALCIYQDLTMHGYDVFFDYQSIDSGNFEKVILENIKARAHFLVVLTPSALERLKEPNDWLRREIETAMDEKRNIVPLMLESFDFGSPLVTQALTGKLAVLKSYNGLRVYSEYFFEAMDKLRERYMNVEVSGIVSLNAEAKGITEVQKTAAREAPRVEKEELTAQEWFERGYVFQQDKNLDEAERSYRNAIELDPSLPEAYSNLGLLLHANLKRYNEAEAAYRKAIELNPSYATAYYNLGNLLSDENLKRYEEAEAAYRKAIELNPSNATAYSTLGILLKNLKRTEEAEAAYRKAIELCEASPSGDNPSYATAYYNLGLLLHENLKRYEEAEAAYRKAIELCEASPSGDNPLYATAYSNLGILLKNLKRYEEAEAAYRKAIELNPSLPEAYSNLGSLLDDLKRYDEAEAAYRKAIELDPSESAAYNNLVILLRLINRIEDAMPLLEKVLEINPEDFNPYLAMASVNKQLGKDISNDHTEKARQFMPEDDWYNRACLESICDNFDLAFEHLQRAAQAEGFNPAWAWDDPDLQWVRDDPRFTKIVGPR